MKIHVKKAPMIRAAASAIVNARGNRRGLPAIENVLDALPLNLLNEVLDDARAALDAVLPCASSGSIVVSLEEEQRQAAILALAWLSIERPGWDEMLSAIAIKMDNVTAAGRPEMFDDLKQSMQATVAVPEAFLRELVRLLDHYGNLLNMDDGSERKPVNLPPHLQQFRSE